MSSLSSPARSGRPQPPTPPPPSADGTPPAAQTPPSPVPHWDKQRRTLTWQRRRLREFTQESKWQELLLDVFEEESWVGEIDNPIPGTPKQARQRLRNAVQHLNERQNALTFHIRGRGTTIRWEVRVPQAQ